MGLWVDFKNRIKTNVSRLSIRKLLLALLCLVLMVAPAVFAVIYRNHVDTTPSVDVFSVTLYDKNGEKFGYDIGAPKSAPADSLVWIFYHIPMEMKQIDSPPGNPAKDNYIRAVTDLNGKTEDMTYYFSMVASASYCKDSQGVFYSIPTAIAEAFLGTSYAEPFYPAARIPQLITIDRDVILPANVQWSYKNYNGVILPAKQFTSAQSTPAYEMTGALGMSFSPEPDFCEAKIYNGDLLVYTGSLREISSLTVDAGKEMTVSVQAIWMKENHPDGYGELQYQFSVRIRNRSEFSIGSDTIPLGGFTTLSCTNITNPSKIDYSSDIEGSAPVFHRDGDVMRALITVPSTTPVGEHTITITYGASSQTFPIRITEPGAQPSFSYPDVSLQNPMAGTDLSVMEWKAMLPNLSPPQPTVYFLGKYLAPSELGFRIGYTHQSKVQWANETVSSAVGCEFITDQSGGASVPALQSGTVVQTGSCALLGNYAVVDHGCGMRLWYGHLSDFDVEIGDIVRQGQSIGKTGTGGASTGNGFVLICTVYDAVVDPSQLLGQTIQ